MKKVITLMILVCLYGCSGGSRYENMETVKKQFPNAIVKTIPGHGYKYIVKDSAGAVWYVETRNLTDTNISLKEQVF